MIQSCEHIKVRLVCNVRVGTGILWDTNKVRIRGAEVPKICPLKIFDTSIFLNTGFFRLRQIAFAFGFGGQASFAKRQILCGKIYLFASGFSCEGPSTLLRAGSAPLTSLNFYYELLRCQGADELCVCDAGEDASPASRC